MFCWYETVWGRIEIKFGCKVAFFGYTEKKFGRFLQNYLQIAPKSRRIGLFFDKSEHSRLLVGAKPHDIDTSGQGGEIEFGAGGLVGLLRESAPV